MHKMYFVYILKCYDQSYYVGMTNNIERRLLEHQFPEYTNVYTALRLPVTLVYLDDYGDVNQAIDREKQIKKWSRKKKEASIEKNIDKLRELSKAYRDLPITLREPQCDKLF
jgi:putative endonuclease